MALVAEDLAKRYGDVEALKALSFHVAPGETLALMGPNGAGKSTAVKILVSLLKPDRGSLSWNGRGLLENGVEHRQLIGYVSQELALDKVMTGLEFLRFQAGICHLNWREHLGRARTLLDQLGLTGAADRQIEGYSGGMKRRLDLAAALLHRPRVLILDEPTNGLDLEARERIWELLRHFGEEGGTVVLVSHDFREARMLAGQVVILRDGEAVRADSAEALLAGLGNYVIKLKTRECMEAGDFTALEKAFADWDGQLEWHPDRGDAASFVYRGDETMAGLHARICQTIEDAGLSVFTLQVQQPGLEDVYRFATGSNA